MTNKSICMKCVELIRIKVSNYSRGTSREERRICVWNGVRETLNLGDTIEECSRYVEVPGDKPKKK